VSLIAQGRVIAIIIAIIPAMTPATTLAITKAIILVPPILAHPTPVLLTTARLSPVGPAAALAHLALLS